ncbi:MAG: hypothetical protein JNM41_02850, partial [Flavipsychrobacter sp.]|nr:hypothetical protein [Flavipsychrobacter sp.]
MKNIQILGLFVIMTAAIFACSKKDSDGTTNFDKSKKRALFADLETEPQKIIIQAGRDTVVFGSNNTILHFYANSFKDAGGNAISSGLVLIELV